MDDTGRPRRFRVPVLVGSLVMVAAAFLPWWRAGGEQVSGVELPAFGGIGLDGPGVVIFVSAVIALALLDIGYARGRWGFALDAPGIYLLLGLAAAIAVVWRGWELWSVALSAAAADLARAHPGRGRGRSAAVRRRYRDGDPPPALGRCQHGPVSAPAAARAEEDPAHHHRHQHRAQQEHGAEVGSVRRLRHGGFARVADGGAGRPRSRPGRPGGPAGWRRGSPPCRPG